MGKDYRNDTSNGEESFWLEISDELWWMRATKSMSPIYYLLFLEFSAGYLKKSHPRRPRGS